MVTKGEGDKRGTHSTRKLEKLSGKDKRFDLNMLLRHSTRSSWHRSAPNFAYGDKSLNPQNEQFKGCTCTMSVFSAA